MKKKVASEIQFLVIGIIALSIFIFSCNSRSETTSEREGNYSLDARLIPEVVDFNFHIKPILSDRCFACHGPDKNKIEAGLSFANFDAATLALGDDKDHYAIVAHKPQLSTLVSRINSEDPGVMMPPPESNLVLDSYEKELLIKWIEQGANYKPHWSFLPVKQTSIPILADASQGYNNIDNYIVAKLNDISLEPSSLAKKEYLIRRLAFNLTGLPPSVEEIENYLNDRSDDAYENLVDRYLAKPAYGEHMASYWMDLSRYADTHGYQDDLERVMWPWRDWVISAYNRNLSYDKFVSNQLAGDMMPNATREQIIATAFNRNHSITQEGGVIPEEYRTEYVSDRTLTFGKAFLGLSVECAKCHDHKYDPISQKDYYSLFAFFNNVPEKGLIEEYGAVPEPYIEITNDEVESILTFINNTDTLDKILLMVMEELPSPRKTFILDRGVYDKPTTQVTSMVPESVLPMKDYQKNRLGLTQWLFDKENPLTARVAVNRLWQMCYGKGIVTTSDDFGAQGSLPTHPELLDHLAAKFMENDWDIKKMLKYIVSSRTYQQSSKITEEMLEIDSENLLYARAPRIRLTAENIRDNALASSGLLVSTIGGPSVKPYQPQGLWKEKTGGGGGSTAEYIVDEGDKQFRRSLYTFWKRTVPPPSMMTFDAVSRDFCMVSRETTSTPLQALVMMNNPEIIRASQYLAYQTINDIELAKDRVAMMFRRATSRNPAEVELNQLMDYLSEQQKHFGENEEAINQYLNIGNVDVAESLPKKELAAYAMVANVIYNLDESLTRS